MNRYCFVILFALSLSFVGGIYTEAQEVDILSESVLVDALEKGRSLFIADILSIEGRGEGMSEVKVKVVQPIISGDLVKEDFEDTLNLSANVLYSKNLKIGSRYALFIIKEHPYEYSWVHRNVFQFIDKSESRTVENLVSSANSAYAKKTLSSFRKDFDSIKDVDLSLIPNEIISLCEQFKSDPENRSVIAEKIFMSDIGSRTKLKSESSSLEYL